MSVNWEGVFGQNFGPNWPYFPLITSRHRAAISTYIKLPGRSLEFVHFFPVLKKCFPFLFPLNLKLKCLCMCSQRVSDRAFKIPRILKRRETRGGEPSENESEAGFPIWVLEYQNEGWESEGDYSSRFHVFKEQDLSSGQIFRMLSWMVTRIELQVRDLNTRAAVISYDLWMSFEIEDALGFAFWRMLFYRRREIPKLLKFQKMSATEI